LENKLERERRGGERVGEQVREGEKGE